MANTSTNTVTGAKSKSRHSVFVNLIMRLIKEKPLGTIGAVIVLILFLIGIFANLLAPYGYEDISLGDRLAPPSSEHILGTDNLGRDLLSRIIYGARVSMIVGISAAALEVCVAILIGVFSGFFGGKFDLFVQRFVDAWMCLPWIFIILTIMSVLSGGGIIQVVIVLGIHRGISGSRIVRSAVLSIKDNIYVIATQAMGCSTLETLTKHILPNIMAPIIIMFTLSMGNMILAEATLSFLGFGVPPPAPSWGSMLSGDARKFMYVAPWLAIWPGVALSIVIFGINMFGDAIRDILDPRLRGGLGRYGLNSGDKKISIFKKIQKRFSRSGF